MYISMKAGIQVKPNQNAIDSSIYISKKMHYYEDIFIRVRTCVCYRVECLNTIVALSSSSYYRINPLTQVEVEPGCRDLALFKPFAYSVIPPGIY